MNRKDFNIAKTKLNCKQLFIILVKEIPDLARQHFRKNAITVVKKFEIV